MTLLSIANQIATNVGLPQQASMQGTDPNALKLVEFINEASKELARRVDWTALNKRQTIVSTGAAAPYDLAPDYARLIKGLSVTVAGNPLRGGISADEWFSLTPTIGTPRYFRMQGNKAAFYPYPSTGQQIVISYQSREWAEDAGGAGKAEMSIDTDKPRVPEDLLMRGATWRWYRHVGRDFSDYLAEFETMLTDLAEAEGGIRQP